MNHYRKLVWHICVSDKSYLPTSKRNSELTVNLKQINTFGSECPVMDLRHIIQSSMQNKAWLNLFDQANGWHIIKNIFLKHKKP